MATFSLRALHQTLAKKYGDKSIGSLAAMHPLVRRMLVECEPNNFGPNSKYMEFITLLDDDCYRGTGTHNKLKFEELVPPEKFYELMSALAVGMQFAVQKAGTPIDAHHYEFQHTYTINGCSFKEFGAAAKVEGNERSIVVNPLIIFQAIVKPEKLRKNLKMDTAGLTMPEIFTLIGVEEMYHLYQVQQGQMPRYRVDKFVSEEHDNDPMEREADTLQAVAITELKLGPNHRGLPR
jgi:hypothetical protein